jgi:hypothetical protein
MKGLIQILLLISCSNPSWIAAQTLGGNAVFNFLNQPIAAKQASLGGVNTTSIGKDLGMAFYNPALLRPDMQGQVSAGFYSFAQGLQQYGFNTAMHLKKYNTNLSFGVQYLDYGNLTQTDASGNILGTFKPKDYVIQWGFSKQYQERWWYGLNAKFIGSSYGQYQSNGIGFDVGIAYYDEELELQASILVKNMGAQLKTYNYLQPKEEIPFDLQLGITKRLEKAPFQFSITAHHLHSWNILYNDSTFNQTEGNDQNKGYAGAQKLLSHLVFSTEIFLNDKLQVNAGLNLLRRQSLNATNLTNGLNGFTLGFGLLLDKLHLHYATGFYQQNLFHQVSFNFNFRGDPL